MSHRKGLGLPVGVVVQAGPRGTPWIGCGSRPEGSWGSSCFEGVLHGASLWLAVGVEAGPLLSSLGALLVGKLRPGRVE